MYAQATVDEDANQFVVNFKKENNIQAAYKITTEDRATTKIRTTTKIRATTKIRTTKK